jgi:signal peptidase I
MGLILLPLRSQSAAPPQKMAGQQNMSRQSTGSFMETVRTIIYAVLIAVVVRAIGYEPFNIPSGSMKPTLLVGDYLFVKKWVYGYSRHSFPMSWPPFSGRIWEAPVQRGDVVVFKWPEDNKTDYIKRIVGLPGDRIQVKAGILYINDQPVTRERIEDWVDENGHRFMRYIETLPNGVRHPIIEDSDDDPLDNTQVFTVPPESYFAMGDNRDNSADSRQWPNQHFVPAENLVGRASFLFYSTAAGNLWPIWDAIPQTRWDRLMTGIH